MDEEQRRIAEIDRDRKSYGWIHALYDVGPPPATRFLQGGAFESPRREVAPGLLPALTRTEARFSSPAGPNSGRRSELARWLTERSSPAAALAARVLVNRVWERLLGKGLAPTVDNLGASGTAPTHPELLEWLAADFVDHGWSIKGLIRQIVASSVYRQASRYPPGQEAAFARAQAVDPDNDLQWRARLVA